MKIIQTDLLTPANITKSKTEALHIYNGLDACVTLEVYEVIRPFLDNTTTATYEFEKSLMGPVLEMSLRGILIDKAERDRLIGDMLVTKARFQDHLGAIVSEGLGISVNFASPAQVKHLFYEVLGLPPIKVRKGHEYVVTTNRDALERLADQYFIAKPLVSHILAIRDLAKKISTLRTEVDADGRMRTSFNIAGTETGRFSSSFSILGTGGNFQNWENRLRRIFIADPGMKFAYVDLEQAESRAVGAIEWNQYDGRYLDACESGDLHTAVAKMCWPTLTWPGDPAGDRAVANQIFYRMFTMRDMTKKLGHGSNYGGQPTTMQKNTKIPKFIIEDFQGVYFAAFGHKDWHTTVAWNLKAQGYLTSLMGRKRWFFGRRDDPATIREAIAYDPQSSVADILDEGMRRVWAATQGRAQLLIQAHDAILVQYPEDREAAILPEVLELIKVPVQLREGRVMVIPSEAKVGWNWADEGPDNPNGLIKFKPGKADARRRVANAKVSIMDTVL